MVNITLPDGNIKSFENSPTGMDVALSISKGLARTCGAMAIDGEIADLHSPIEGDSQVRLITTKDPEATEILRHSAAHVMAQAILRICPEAQLTIGPVVEGGFYYDIDMPPLSEEAFPAIEAEMKKIVKAKLPITRKMVAKEKALSFYRNEPYKLEMISALADGTSDDGK